ncbi:MAG: hypothetical protein PHW04_08330 [Candidatus Wallbacteria bacterium]|nr:hypothetical protein [Candidatus Wallbacteria bacterium]
MNLDFLTQIDHLLILFSGTVLGLFLYWIVSACARHSAKNEKLQNSENIDELLDIKFQLIEIYEEFKKNSALNIRQLETKTEELKELLAICDEKVLYFNSLGDEIDGRYTSLERKIAEFNRSLPARESIHMPVQMGSFTIQDYQKLFSTGDNRNPNAALLPVQKVFDPKRSERPRIDITLDDEHQLN